MDATTHSEQSEGPLDALRLKLGPQAVLIGPGYRDGHWTKASWTDKGVRDKVGAAHFPLAGLLNAVGDAGLVLERFAEGGAPTPQVLAARARKPVPGAMR